MKQLLITPLLLLSVGFSLSATSAQVSIDAVIAIVEDDVITRRELSERTKLIRLDFVQSNRSLPNDDRLRRQVLEAMIRNSILLQEAQRRGLKITEGQLNQTMQKISRDNQMNLTQLRQALINKGLDYEKFREEKRSELLLNALRRQYTARLASVSDQEVDDFLDRNNDGDISYEYKLAHILIGLADAPTPKQVTDAQQLAAEIISKLDSGSAFESLANEYSNSSTALGGGDLGWRKKAEIPSLFTEAVMPLKAGEYAGPFRSASGYHMVYLTDRKDTEQVLSQQIRSRHILLKSNKLTTEDEVEKRLLEFRQRILDGEPFDRLAKLYSIDYGTGAAGGDIGWMEDGDTVPAYQEVMNSIEEGNVSMPFKSRFGWHILEVTGKRIVDETAESRREKVYRQLLLEKQRELFDIWQQRLRDEAYVVIPDAS